MKLHLIRINEPSPAIVTLAQTGKDHPSGSSL
jgi:hypothetical protein